MMFNYLQQLVTRYDSTTPLDSQSVQNFSEKSPRIIKKQQSATSLGRPWKRKRKPNVTKQCSFHSVSCTHLSISHASTITSSECTYFISQKRSKCSAENLTSELINGITTSTKHHIILPAQKKMKLPLLASIKPENYRKEKQRFMESNFNYNPYFVYPKQLDGKVMDKFRAPSNKYIPQAILIMRKVLADFGSYEAFEEINGGRLLTRSQICNVVERCLKVFGLAEEIKINLCSDLLSQGSLTRVRGQTILNVRCVNLRENWAEGLLRHEIGTHYYRSCNNRYQPWYNIQVRNKLKMQPMNPTEEGLASLHSVLFRAKPFLWRPALLYYTAYMASKMSFQELFSDLGKFVKNPHVRWDYCLRAKRGQEWTCKPGCFSKDQVYLEGALELLKWRRVLDFQLLVRLGKVSHKDINRPDLLKIAQLKETRIPWFLEDIKVYLQKLEHIAYTNGLTDSVLDFVQ